MTEQQQNTMIRIITCLHSQTKELEVIKKGYKKLRKEMLNGLDSYLIKKDILSCLVEKDVVEADKLMEEL